MPHCYFSTATNQWACVNKYIHLTVTFEQKQNKTLDTKTVILVQGIDFNIFQQFLICVLTEQQQLVATWANHQVVCMNILSCICSTSLCTYPHFISLLFWKFTLMRPLWDCEPTPLPVLWLHQLAAMNLPIRNIANRAEKRAVRVGKILLTL